jgi:hypothetical protein
VTGTGALGERMLGRPVCAMGFEPVLFSGRPCDLSGCALSANPSVSFAHLFSWFCGGEVMEV